MKLEHITSITKVNYFLFDLTLVFQFLNQLCFRWSFTGVAKTLVVHDKLRLLHFRSYCFWNIQLLFNTKASFQQIQTKTKNLSFAVFYKKLFFFLKGCMSFRKRSKTVNVKNKDSHFHYDLKIILTMQDLKSTLLELHCNYVSDFNSLNTWPK